MAEYRQYKSDSSEKSFDDDKKMKDNESDEGVVYKELQTKT